MGSEMTISESYHLILSSYQGTGDESAPGSAQLSESYHRVTARHVSQRLRERRGARQPCVHHQSARVQPRGKARGLGGHCEAS